MTDNVHQIGLGADGAEGAGMDAVSALDALILVNVADAVIIIGDGADRADALAGPDQMRDRPVRTGICAHAALFTLAGIDPGPVCSDRNSAEAAGIDTCLAHTQTAVVCYCIGRNRTFLTGGLDHLHDIFGIALGIGVLGKRKTYPLLRDLPLLVDTAAVIGDRSRTDLIGQLSQGFIIDIVFPCQFRDPLHNVVFQTYQCGIIGNHAFSPFAVRMTRAARP